MRIYPTIRNHVRTENSASYSQLFSSKSTCGCLKQSTYKISVMYSAVQQCALHFNVLSVRKDTRKMS